MSRPGASTYPLGKPTRVCAASGRTLTVGERYVAALVENPADGRFERRDFALAAWQGGARPGPPARLVGSWRTVLADPGAAPRPILDDEAMLELIEQIEPGSARQDALRLVLAIMLVRRRVLVQEPAARESVMMLRRRGDPRPPEGPALIEVRDAEGLGLDAATLSDVMAELEALVGAGIGQGEGP